MSEDVLELIALDRVCPAGHKAYVVANFQDRVILRCFGCDEDYVIYK